MINIMKGIIHHSLEGSTSILHTKRELFVRKDSPRTNESSFLLINGENVNLVISRKTDHKRKNLTLDTFVDDLIYKGSGIIIFRTCPIDSMIVNTNVDSSLFLSRRNNIENPIYQWDRINETNFKMFFNFSLYGSFLSRVHRMMALTKRLLIWISRNLMQYYTWIYARNLFVWPRKDITKLFEEGSINLDLIWKKRNPNMDIFDNPWFDRDVDGHCSWNVPHISFGKDFMNQKGCLKWMIQYIRKTSL